MWGREKIGVKFVWFTLMDFSLREVHCICVYREREKKKLFDYNILKPPTCINLDDFWFDINYSVLACSLMDSIISLITYKKKK